VGETSPHDDEPRGARSRRKVDAAELEAAKRGINTDARAQALNVFTNYLNNLAGTDVDFPVIALEQAA